MRRALARANHLMVEERFSDAADIFERLSGQARQRGMLGRAANLTLQASRARFVATDVESALDHAREAMRLFIRAGRPERVSPVLARMTAALREQGSSQKPTGWSKRPSRHLGRLDGRSIRRANGHPVFLISTHFRAPRHLRSYPLPCCSVSSIGTLAIIGL